ncbi:MAG TPA: DUF2231 domain-containing protein [Luteitalea sp.]|nr:DUF2231 domain-containing protein [Luteitalea sp.]
MKSTAHVIGHRIHPMRIPYPCAWLSASKVFDLAAQGRSRAPWAHTVTHLRRVGLVTAVAAAVPGIIGDFGTVRSHSGAT